MKRIIKLFCIALIAICVCVCFLGCNNKSTEYTDGTVAIGVFRKSGSLRLPIKSVEHKKEVLNTPETVQGLNSSERFVSYKTPQKLFEKMESEFGAGTTCTVYDDVLYIVQTDGDTKHSATLACTEKSGLKYVYTLSSMSSSVSMGEKRVPFLVPFAFFELETDTLYAGQKYKLSVGINEFEKIYTDSGYSVTRSGETLYVVDSNPQTIRMYQKVLFRDPLPEEIAMRLVFEQNAVTYFEA